MKPLFHTHHCSVSLAHRYWVGALSLDQNTQLFASSMSPDGLGHNFDVSVSFKESVSEKSRQEILNHVKKLWDHSSWVNTSPGECSSLEVLVWKLIYEIGTKIESIRVHESSELSVSWSKLSPEQLTLVHTRPVSVLWTEGGGARLSGARLKMEFGFQSAFQIQDHVLFARSLLERDLEEYLLGIEDPGFKLSTDVKENEKIMDAMFNEIKEKIPSLISICCELENQKKWLNHFPILTR